MCVTWVNSFVWGTSDSYLQPMNRIFWGFALPIKYVRVSLPQTKKRRTVAIHLSDGWYLIVQRRVASGLLSVSSLTSLSEGSRS